MPAPVPHFHYWSPRGDKLSVTWSSLKHPLNRIPSSQSAGGSARIPGELTESAGVWIAHVHWISNNKGEPILEPLTIFIADDESLMIPPSLETPKSIRMQSATKTKLKRKNMKSRREPQVRTNSTYR